MQNITAPSDHISTAGVYEDMLLKREAIHDLRRDVRGRANCSSEGCVFKTLRDAEICYFDYPIGCRACDKDILV
jgi:hypothetical protein